MWSRHKICIFCHFVGSKLPHRGYFIFPRQISAMSTQRKTAHMSWISLSKSCLSLRLGLNIITVFQLVQLHFYVIRNTKISNESDDSWACNEVASPPSKSGRVTTFQIRKHNSLRKHFSKSIHIIYSSKHSRFFLISRVSSSNWSAYHNWQLNIVCHLCHHIQNAFQQI